MSETEASDRQHQATSKRLTELRKKGTVMRSRDLSGALLFIIGMIVLINASSSFKHQFLDNFSSAYGSIKEVAENPDYLFIVLRKIIINNIYILFPIFGLLFLAVFLSPFLFGGWNFSMSSVAPNFGKLNPITNLANIFSPKRAVVEIAKSVMKVVVLMGVLAYFFMSNEKEILALVNYPPKVAIMESYSIIVNFIFTMCLSLMFIVGFDMIQQFFQYQSKVKMSTQELKDEHKESEGSGEVKRKVKSMQFQLMKQRLAQSVPKANVIITNPTHYSVALRYDDRKDHAPKVVAKGKGALAKQIRHIAITNAIPIYEAPTLARAIYHTTKIGRDIHPALYMAVAIVLSYVHQLKSYQMGVGRPPTHVPNLEVPEEFIYNE